MSEELDEYLNEGGEDEEQQEMNNDPNSNDYYNNEEGEREVEPDQIEDHKGEDEDDDRQYNGNDKKSSNHNTEEKQDENNNNNNNPPTDRSVNNLFRNKQIVAGLFKEFSGEIQQYFKEFSQKQEQQQQQQQQQQQNNLKPSTYDYINGDEENEYNSTPKQNLGAVYNNHHGESCIAASDVPLVLRISFYYGNITFHATKEDVATELFNLPNSYKHVMSSLERFFLEERNARAFDPIATKVVYSDFVAFAYFFVESDSNLYLAKADENPQNSAAGDDIMFQAENSSAAAASVLERELRENIIKYEDILQNPLISPAEKIIAQTTIESLKHQLATLLARKELGERSKRARTLQSGRSVKPSKEELRLKHLKEAFIFYSKQQNVTGTTFTFDRIVHEQNIVNLACFMLMLKHYEVLNSNKYVTKREIQIMFKKHALNYKELDFETFKVMLEKVAIAFYRDVPDLTNIEKVEKFYEFIKLDQPQVFKSRRQLLNQPFNIREKQGFRLLPFDQGREILLKKVSPMIREKIKNRQEEKRNQNLFSAPSMQQSQFESIKAPSRNLINRGSTPQIFTREYHSPSQHNIFSQPTAAGPSMQASGLHGGQSVVVTGYANSKKLKTTPGRPELILKNNNKVSWQQLEQLSFSDMKNINNGLFKPTDLFNEDNDDEDRIYLAEYNLQEDKMRKIQESIMNKRGQENYGQMKQSIRPSLKYLQKHDPNYGKITSTQSVTNVHRGHHHSQDDMRSRNQSNILHVAGGGGGGTTATGNHSVLLPHPMSAKQIQINSNYQLRAHQVDVDQKSREKAILQNILNANQQKISRGIHAAYRGKSQLA